MTDVIFSFDTEDFTSNTAADAIYREAEILRQEGVRGGFCIVGLLAEQFKNWERSDIVEALRHHDILSHSYGHSLHPTLNEYTDVEDFDAAYEEMMRQETKALKLIEDVTGQKVIGACPPGNQKTYVAMYGYGDMGLPIYADTFCDTADGNGVFYCNVYHMQYTTCMEEELMDTTAEDIKKLLDGLTKYKRVIIYTHPNIALYTEFWDKVNYYKENKCEFGKWAEAPRRPAEESERFYDNIRRLVRMIKADDRFNITSYSDVYATLSREGERVIKTDDIPYIREALKGDFAPINSPVSLSISDVFLACRDMLLGKREHVCGKVYGFLEAPIGVSEPVTLKRADMIKSAREMNADGFLPTKIGVADVEIGPADWLRAALDILCGEECATVMPASQLPKLDVLPQLKNLTFKGGWVQSDSFEDKYLSDRLRYQAWTMRFPKFN